MRTHQRSALCTAIERALLARDRREMASIERVMKMLRVKQTRLRTRKRHA
jgi:hypothetical protein